MYKIIVIDFDGTLIKDDSIKLYCKWLSKNIIDFHFNYHIRFRSHQIFNYKIDIKHERVKFFFERQRKYKIGINEFNKILKKNLFSDSLNLIKKNPSKLDVYIVSASFAEIIESFCIEFLKVKLITNNLKDYNTLNDINFKNKVTVLNSKIKDDYTIVKGYGNSAGDYDFMNISDDAFLRLSNGKLIQWQK